MATDSKRSDHQTQISWSKAEREARYLAYLEDEYRKHIAAGLGPKEFKPANPLFQMPDESLGDWWIRVEAEVDTQPLPKAMREALRLRAERKTD